jgi:predicted O-linked N-acetylglucosamine transferase (SPINDLY family)
MPETQLRLMALELWMAYNQILWRRCANMNWLVVAYESFFDRENATQQCERLAEYCGLERSKVASAVASIEKPRPEPFSTEIENVRALELYSTLTRHPTSRRQPGTTIQAEPDEARLVVRAKHLIDDGQIGDAVDLLTKGLAIHPYYRAARFLLGYTLMRTGHVTESNAHSQLLIDSDPGDPVGYGLKAFGLTQQARIAEAMQAYEESSTRLPTNNAAWSNQLFAALYADHLTPGDVTRLHRVVGSTIERNALSTLGTEEAFTPPVRGKRVRVGYLSADLKRHPVGFFMRSVLANHDPDACEVTCYDTGACRDDLTTVLREDADHWCDAAAMSDDELCRKIRADQIDVLVDLGGHSEGNRAGMLARRAAPVQALYLGYPSTTGLPSMDYLISDRWVSPPEFDEFYTERVHRLDQCFLCFHPYEDAPPVAESPFQRNGFVTFGSFNHLPKISPTTIQLWSRILLQASDARLVLKSLSLVDAATREYFYRQFDGYGVDRTRIDLLPPTVPLSKFLGEYRLVDVGLDPMPFNGGTTTCESLWMGVPVVSMPGKTFCSRMGTSILNAIGMGDWVADTPAAYVDRACQLAADPRHIAVCRGELRSRMQDSPLMDGRSFTRGLESAYRSMLESI